MFITELINDEVGEMSWTLPNKEKVWCKLYPLTDHDKEEFRQVDLKPEEALYRYETINTRRFYNPLIKVNAKKGLIYFLRDIESDRAWFNTKGTKARVTIYN